MQESTSRPANSATVSIVPAPSCGGGTGYYETDTVFVSALPAEGNRVTGFSGGTIDGSIRWPYAASDVTLQPVNGSASMMIHPPLMFTATGQMVPFGIQANTVPTCVSVRFSVTGIADRSAALSMLVWDVPFNSCGNTVSFGTGNSYTASIPNGTVLQVRYQDGFIPANVKFYGWEGITSGDPYARTATYTIGADTRITANFGPVCFANGPNVTQPTYGTITVNLPAPNCNDPSTGKSGWLVNTPGSATLVDSVGTSLQVISTRYGSLNGRWQRIDETAWLPEKPVFFDGWTGDTSAWSEGAAVISTDAAGVRHTSRTITFRVGQSPFAIGANYGGMRRAHHEGARRCDRRHTRLDHDEHAVELPGRRGHRLLSLVQGRHTGQPHDDQDRRHAEVPQLGRIHPDHGPLLRQHRQPSRSTPTSPRPRRTARTPIAVP